MKEAAQLDSVDLLLELLRLRECILFERMVKKFALLRNQSRTLFDIYSRFLTTEQLAYTSAFINRVSLEQTIETARSLKESDNTDLVLLFARIFAVEVVLNDLALFLTSGIIEAKAA